MDKRVSVRPFEGGGNEYIELIKKCLSDLDFRLMDYHEGRFRCDIVILNWFENLGDESRLERIITYIKHRGCLWLYKMKGIKVVWVMHNRRPHSHAGWGTFTLMKNLAKKADRIVVLCDDGLSALEEAFPGKGYPKKTVKILHPAYIEVLSEKTMKGQSEKMNLLFFGRVMPYKQIELLIDAVRASRYKDHIRVRIMGPAPDKDYLECLKGQLDRDEVFEISPGFLELDELQRVVKGIDAFVVPLDVRSSMNSGTVMMAFSLARTVICPRIGTVKEYPTIDEFAYCYSYSSKEEHLCRLTESIDKAYEDYKDNPLGLQKKGELAYNVVKEINSMAVVTDSLRRLMSEILE